MAWPKQPEITVIECQYCCNLIAFGNCHNRCVNKIDTAISVLLQNLGDALYVLIGQSYQLKLACRQLPQERCHCGNPGYLADKIGDFGQNGLW